MSKVDRAYVWPLITSLVLACVTGCSTPPDAEKSGTAGPQPSPTADIALEEWATLGRLDPCALLRHTGTLAKSTLSAPDPHSCSARSETSETHLQVGFGFDADAREAANSNPKVTSDEIQGINVFQEKTGSGDGECMSLIPVGDGVGVRIGSDRTCEEATEVVTGVVKTLVGGAGVAVRDVGVHENHTACDLMGSPDVPDGEPTAEPGNSGAECRLTISTPPTSELFASLSMSYDDAWPDVANDPDLGTSERIDGRDVVYTTLTGTCEARVRLDTPTQPEASHDWLVATLRSQDCARLQEMVPDVIAAWQSPPPRGVDIATLLDAS